MGYKANKIDGQSLMFRIETENNGVPVSFNVVCASDESEIPELVAHHLNYLNNPPAPTPYAQQQINPITLLQEQQQQIDALKAEVAALKGN